MNLIKITLSVGNLSRDSNKTSSRHVQTLPRLRLSHPQPELALALPPTRPFSLGLPGMNVLLFFVFFRGRMIHLILWEAAVDLLNIDRLKNQTISVHESILMLAIA